VEQTLTEPGALSTPPPCRSPRVLLIGGPDVDARLDLMRALAGEFTMAAAGSNPALGPAFERAGFPYFAYSLAGPPPFADLRALFALGRMLRRFRPHIVHAFDAKPGVYGCLAAARAGVPVIVNTVPGLGSLYVDGGLRRRALRAVYECLQGLASRRADRTTFQNLEDKEEFVACGIVPAGRTALIPGSGVRTDLFDPAILSEEDRRRVRSSLGVPADTLLVTMVARVIRTKGVAEFVAAARDVGRHFPKSRFLLVGAPDPASVDRFPPVELAEFARAVLWPGTCRDVRGVLAASDLFVLPSYLREGIPRALLEAAAMALPLITTDTPGCKEVVEDGVNGFLVPVRDSAALAQAIDLLLRRPDLRREFGPRSRRLAVERFDLSVVAARTRVLYQELLAREAPAPGQASL
jgi:glycosyltransferase involved in cell wall biosynthesis